MMDKITLIQFVKDASGIHIFRASNIFGYGLWDALHKQTIPQKDRWSVWLIFWFCVHNVSEFLVGCVN